MGTSRLARPVALVALVAAGALGWGACTTVVGPPGDAAPGTSEPGTTMATTTTVPRTPTLSATSTVSTVGLDQVFFGMTLDEAVEAAGTELTVEGDPAGACFRAVPDQAPPGITFTFVDGRVERVDVGAPPVATRSGARVGATRAQVAQLYGDQLEGRPRPDGQPGDLLVLVPRDEADAQFRLVFTTDGTTVVSYRAGRLPVIERDPPC